MIVDIELQDFEILTDIVKFLRTPTFFCLWLPSIWLQFFTKQMQFSPSINSGGECQKWFSAIIYWINCIMILRCKVILKFHNKYYKYWIWYSAIIFHIIRNFGFLVRIFDALFWNVTARERVYIFNNKVLLKLEIRYEMIISKEMISSLSTTASDNLRKVANLHGPKKRHQDFELHSLSILHWYNF